MNRNLFWLLKKNPSKAGEIISTSNEYIKHLQVDKDTSTILTPIFNISSKVNHYGGFSRNQNNLAEQRIVNSGKTNTTKRSVSETKKKYKVIFTGGYANLFKTSIRRSFVIDRNITISGIIEICISCS